MKTKNLKNRHNTFIILFLWSSIYSFGQGNCDCCNHILFDYPDTYEFLFPPEFINKQKIKSINITFQDSEIDSSKILSTIYFNKKGNVIKSNQYNYGKYVSQKIIKRNRKQKITAIIEIESDSNGVLNNSESMTSINKYYYYSRSYIIRNYFWIGRDKDYKHYTETIYNLDSLGRTVDFKYSSKNSVFPDDVKLNSKTDYSKNNDSIVTKTFYNDSLSMISTDMYNDRKQYIGNLSEIYTVDGIKRVQLTVFYDSNNSIVSIKTTPLDKIGFTECPDQNDNIIYFKYNNGLIHEVTYEYSDAQNNSTQKKYIMNISYIFR